MTERKTTKQSEQKHPGGRPVGTAIYTKEEVDQAVKILFENDLNYKLTARTLGIDQKTLKIWSNKRFLEMIRNRKIEEGEIEDEDAKSIEELREIYERKSIKAKTDLLERIIELAPNFKTPAILSKMLRVIHETATPERQTSPEGKPPALPAGPSIMNTLIERLTIQQDGSKDNRTGGDSKELAG